MPFVTTLEPLLRSSVPKLIHYLDELEQKGVLRETFDKANLPAEIEVRPSDSP